MSDERLEVPARRRVFLDARWCGSLLLRLHTAHTPPPWTAAPSWKMWGALGSGLGLASLLSVDRTERRFTVSPMDSAPHSSCGASPIQTGMACGFVRSVETRAENLQAPVRRLSVGFGFTLDMDAVASRGATERAFGCGQTSRARALHSHTRLEHDPRPRRDDRDLWGGLESVRLMPIRCWCAGFAHDDVSSLILVRSVVRPGTGSGYALCERWSRNGRARVSRGGATRSGSSDGRMRPDNSRPGRPAGGTSPSAMATCEAGEATLFRLAELHDPDAP